MPSSPYQDQLIAAATRLRAEGHTYAQIGLHLGITQEQAWYWANHETSRRSNNESQNEHKARGHQSVWDWWQNEGGDTS